MISIFSLNSGYPLGHYHYPHFAEELPKAQRGKATCSRAFSKQWKCSRKPDLLDRGARGLNPCAALLLEHIDLPDELTGTSS